jgi:hypothetical protein
MLTTGIGFCAFSELNTERMENAVKIIFFKDSGLAMEETP